MMRIGGERAGRILGVSEFRVRDATNQSDRASLLDFTLDKDAPLLHSHDPHDLIGVSANFRPEF
jgi:hypothetical protein